MSGKIKAATIRESNTEVMAIVNGDGSKSSKIRSLFAAGVEKSTIASLMDIRYQHVRNVLLQPLKVKEEAAVKEKTEA